MINLLDPTSKYFHAATDPGASDYGFYNYWYTSVPGELSRTTEGSWNYWDIDGYSTACYFMRGYEGGLPDVIDPCTISCTLTVADTRSVQMSLIESSYSGRWAVSGFVNCQAGVPTTITLSVPGCYGYGHDRLSFMDESELSDQIFAIEITALTVEFPPPPSNVVANFNAVLLMGSDRLTATFTDTSTNTPTSWLWEFGDGTTSTEQNPVHIYNLAGTYAATLTATNDVGSDAITRVLTTIFWKDLVNCEEKDS